MLFIELFEKQNQPKLSAVEQLKQFIGTDYEDELYVHFTDIEKIGINPQSTYKTPAGIYAYPFKYVKDKIIKFDSLSLPYGDTLKYIYVIRATSDKILNLEKYTKNDLKRDEHKLSVYGDKKYFNNLYPNVDTPGGKLWRDLYVICGSNVFLWNALLRGLGYDIVYDNDEGIIHENEPTQAIFLTVKAFQVVKLIHNINPKPLDTKIEKELFHTKEFYEKYIKNKSYKEICDFISPHVIAGNYKLCLRIEKYNPALLFEFMNHIGVNNQLINFVSGDFLHVFPSAYFGIKYLKNITPQIADWIISKNIYDAKYVINKFDEEHQIKAIQKSHSLYSEIKNPSDRVKLALINSDPFMAYQLIKSPSIQFLKLMIRKQPSLIKKIENPSPELQIIAMKNTRFPDTLIYDIDGPVCDKAAKYAIDHGLEIRHLNTVRVSDNIKWYFIKLDPKNILYIANPTEEMMLYAVKKDKSIYGKLLSPTQKVKEFYNKLKEAK